MLTREGCRERLKRFRDGLGTNWDAAVLSLPEHLLYLANFFPSPAGLNLQSSCFLLVQKDGSTELFLDNWHADGVGHAPAAETTSADSIHTTPWYDCEAPAVLRAQAVAGALADRLRQLGVERLAAETAHLPWSVAGAVSLVHDCEPLLRKMREIKDADELEAIRLGVRTAEAVHSASRELLVPGIREIDYYSELVAHATRTAQQPFIMMCDLASGDRAAQGGGGPTDRIIQEGELVILDIFPYVSGYRGDITNTLVCGGKATPDQIALFDTVLAALEAAEVLIRPETPAKEFSRVINETFGSAGKLVHHAGHAIGLGHPEAPELVPQSQRVLEKGMVLTLEPGLYARPWGGLRLEHDYLVTDSGFERLSSHTLGLI